MRALVLGAGMGTRLGALTAHTPKILVPFAGRPLLAWQLEYLERNGVTEVAVNAHHLADQVVDFVAGHTPPPAVRVSREETIRGTAGALWPLQAFLSEPFVVVYGDVVSDLALAELMDEHTRRGALATLALYRSPITQAKGTCTISRDGWIESFAEKADVSSAVSYVNAGLHAIDPAIFQWLEPTDFDFGSDVWPRLAAGGARLAGVLSDAYVRDLGTLPSLEQAEADLRAGVLSW
ncbi:MAG TPA: NDP-sugar synthase [Solirubrobacteraceae bacterium]|nr:NDP-sugar synthase [Solirubrobacteraceae bacterium]